MSGLIGFAIVAVLAVIVLTRPWWWPARRTEPRQRAANVAAYRTRLVELDREVEAGLLPLADAETLKAEAAARLMADAEAPEAEPESGATVERPAIWLGVLLALLLPALAALAYWQSDSWRVQSEIAAVQEGAGTAPEVKAMVDRLAEKMKADPSDPRGWLLLARSYFNLQRYADAAKAYAEANARNGGADAEGLSGEGEARIFADPRGVSRDTAQLFDRALAATPDDKRALWFGGMADAQLGNLPRARLRWTKLAAMPLSPEAKAAVDQQLAELDDAIAQAMPQSGPSTAANADSNIPAVALDLTVSIDPALVASIPPGATLFVYAQADGGPPMPLAVYRKPVASFPVEVRLDDSMAMTPAMRLSQFEHYRVTARISASGGAKPEAGDLEGSISLDRIAAANPARIVIEHKRP